MDPPNCAMPCATIPLTPDSRERVEEMLQVLRRVDHQAVIPIAVSPHFRRTVDNRFALCRPVPRLGTGALGRRPGFPRRLKWSG